VQEGFAPAPDSSSDSEGAGKIFQHRTKPDSKLTTIDVLNSKVMNFGYFMNFATLSLKRLKLLNTSNLNEEYSPSDSFD